MSADTHRAEWVRFSVTANDAVRSWFNGMADDMSGPISAVGLEKPDGRVTKLRAIFVDTDGRRRELTRTFGKTFTITISDPNERFWRKWS